MSAKEFEKEWECSSKLGHDGNGATPAKDICSDTKANVITEGSGINLHEDLTLFSSGGLMRKKKKIKLRVTICSTTIFTKIFRDSTHIVASGRWLKESVTRHGPTGSNKD